MAEEKLNIEERFKVIRTQQEAYRQGTREEKGRILDALEAITHLSRKRLIRHLNGPCQRKRRTGGRRRRYGPEVEDALLLLYRAYGEICPERLTPNLVPYAEKLAAHQHLVLTPSLREALEHIGASTVRRILQRRGVTPAPSERRSPRAHQGLLAGIPAKRIPWQETQPGHLEVDLVHHCGTEARGEYVHTLHMVDVATGWSEMAALLGRGYVAMEDALRRCAQRLPFPVQEIHPDNGSEFFNNHLARFFPKLFKRATVSRSRPWQKNDNRFVEHRNGALIRAWLGYARLDTVEQTLALNRFYEKLRLYHNFFQPVMRLVEKTFDPQTRRVKRRWDTPRTPLERLLASNTLKPKVAKELRRLYEQTDPLALLQTLEAELQALFQLPGAQPGRTEDVFSTLLPDHPMSKLGKEEASPSVSFSNDWTRPLTSGLTSHTMSATTANRRSRRFAADREGGP